MKNIAVLGLGIIGGTWAKHFHEDGWKVRGWNRTAQPELPYFVADIVQAVTGAEVIFIIVADPAAVNSILDQVVPLLQPDQTVIQSSTISADWTKKFAERVQATGAAYLEAPFTGSKPAAEARKVVYYLGGDEALAKKLDPVLAPVSSNRLYIGALGTASSLKLAMNLNIAGVAAILSESLTLARSQGIPDDVYFAALDLNVSKSGLVELKKQKLIKEDFSPQFSLKHMGKDLRLALETAGSLDLPQAKNLKSIYDRGLSEGWGDEDFTVLQRFLSTK